MEFVVERGHLAPEAIARRNIMMIVTAGAAVPWRSEVAVDLGQRRADRIDDCAKAVGIGFDFSAEAPDDRGRR